MGDVHGCLEELKELVETVNTPEAGIMYIFCGDILNKGPYSVETLRYARGLTNSLVVRGNHEEHILKHCIEIAENPAAAANLPDKYQWIRNLTAEEIDYLFELPYTISIPSHNAIIVHAGLYPWKTLDHQELDDMVLMRNIINSENSIPLASKCIETGVPWATMWTGPEHIYFGHDAQRGLQQYPLCTGLDLGCVYGGELAAVFLTGDKDLIRIKARKIHRKPSSGAKHKPTK